jgi:hypothetical protein
MPTSASARPCASPSSPSPAREAASRVRIASQRQRYASLRELSAPIASLAATASWAATCGTAKAIRTGACVFFDRRVAGWSDDAVHERVIAQGEVDTLAGDLLHDSAESLENYLAKQNRYSTLGQPKRRWHEASGPT